jgi:hypothetical protein
MYEPMVENGIGVASIEATDAVASVKKKFFPP